MRADPRRVAAALLIAILLACNAERNANTTDSAAADGPQVTSKAATGTVGPSGARIAVPHAGPPGEWQMPAGDYANSRYSELSSITPQNAANLRVSWAFSTGVLRGHEGQPLVIDNTMYVVTPYPNVSYAIDLAQTGQPLKWKFRPVNSQQAIDRMLDVESRRGVRGGKASTPARRAQVGHHTATGNKVADEDGRFLRQR